MSAFLGKIHYWLFNKILWFEGLEKDIINLAKEQGLDVELLIKEINGKYGYPIPKKPLEEIIDTSNIHGWLQSRINSAEGRMASWTTKLLNTDDKDIIKGKLENIYIKQGIKAAKELKETGIKHNTAVDIFNSINDYILDGMPCDRVNEVVVSEEDNIQWKRRICVHSDIWKAENGDVDYFYTLRSLWVKAFVNEVNSNFQYTEIEDGVMAISRA
jgi:hypothetical protein